MKIKVEGAEMSVTLTVSYKWRLADDPWTASPTGIIGADAGYWTRSPSGWGPWDILFYANAADEADDAGGGRTDILLFESVTRHSHGNPFHSGQTGSGLHLSAGGTMLTGAVIDWEVLSM